MQNPETREMVERHLAQAEEAVRRGRFHLARQIEIVAELERDGRRNASQARALLITFKGVQGSHEAHRERLLAELVQCAKE